MTQAILEVPVFDNSNEGLDPAAWLLQYPEATPKSQEVQHVTSTVGALATQEYLPAAEKSGSEGGGSGSGEGTRETSVDEVKETTWNEDVEEKGGKLPKREPGKSGHK